MKLASIAFIGAGKMATAIAGGLVKKGVDAALIKAYDISEAARAHFLEATESRRRPRRGGPSRRGDSGLGGQKPQHVASALAKSKSLLSSALWCPSPPE
jgi:pyrroline-5-carboxylate reductase